MDSVTQKYSIYILYDPCDESIKGVHYVGMSKQPYVRYGQHLGIGDRNHRKNAWIQSLTRDNIIPMIAIIERVDTEKEAKKRETFWIQKYLENGAPLTNVGFSKEVTAPLPEQEDELMCSRNVYAAWRVEVGTTLERLVIAAIAHLVDNDEPIEVSEIARMSSCSERSVSTDISIP